MRDDFDLTMTWHEGEVRFLDQTLLPVEEKLLAVRDFETMAEAIKKLRIRGAPAIGVAAAFGMALTAWHGRHRGRGEMIEELQRAHDVLRATRPTAVNLFWALSGMMNEVEAGQELEPDALAARLVAKAIAIQEEDIAIGMALGRAGATLIEDGDVVSTHCNAGGLATAGMGSALSVLYYARKNGVRFSVFADETRPLLQGARLTAWELKRWGIPVTVICDNMAGMLMKAGRITKVITGADRIARNGDAANKIGTYALAVLARHHGIPFYIAAPYSTFDPKIESGSEIPIEERDPAEIKAFNGKQIVPEGVDVYNPAFDVVPAGLIAGLITEKGILRAPYTESINRLLEGL